MKFAKEVALFHMMHNGKIKQLFQQLSCFYYVGVSSLNIKSMSQVKNQFKQTSFKFFKTCLLIL